MHFAVKSEHQKNKRVRDTSLWKFNWLQPIGINVRNFSHVS